VKKLGLFVNVLLLGVSLLSTAFAADASGNPAASANAAAPQNSYSTPAQVQTPQSAKPGVFESAGKIGLGVKISLLGVGVEAAVPVMSHANLRAGFNFFNYDRTLSQDGVTYAGKLNFRSTEAYFDWFPFHGSFHLSPGLLVYNGNKITANSNVAGNQTFTFNDTDYISDPNNPLNGNAKLDFKRVAPAFVFGWGNLVPRSHKHWSVPVEFGVIYQSQPRLGLNFSGNACDSSGVNCQPVTSDPSFQSNLQAEQDKLNHDIAPFKFYPVISVGFGYKF
jgi:hypothetical protein